MGLWKTFQTQSITSTYKQDNITSLRGKRSLKPGTQYCTWTCLQMEKWEPWHSVLDILDTDDSSTRNRHCPCVSSSRRMMCEVAGRWVTGFMIVKEKAQNQCHPESGLSNDEVPSVSIHHHNADFAKLYNILQTPGVILRTYSGARWESLYLLEVLNE